KGRSQKHNVTNGLGGFFGEQEAIITMRYGVASLLTLANRYRGQKGRNAEPAPYLHVSGHPGAIRGRRVIGWRNEVDHSRTSRAAFALGKRSHPVIVDNASVFYAQDLHASQYCHLELTAREIT